MARTAHQAARALFHARVLRAQSTKDSTRRPRILLARPPSLEFYPGLARILPEESVLGVKFHVIRVRIFSRFGAKRSSFLNPEHSGAPALRGFGVDNSMPKGQCFFRWVCRAMACVGGAPRPMTQSQRAWFQIIKRGQRSNDWSANDADKRQQNLTGAGRLAGAMYVAGSRCQEAQGHDGRERQRTAGGEATPVAEVCVRPARRGT